MLCKYISFFLIINTLGKKITFFDLSAFNQSFYLLCHILCSETEFLVKHAIRC